MCPKSFLKDQEPAMHNLLGSGLEKLTLPLPSDGVWSLRANACAQRCEELLDGPAHGLTSFGSNQ